MDKNLSKACGLLGISLAAMFSFAGTIPRSDAYLPRTGPVALRFQPSHPQNLSLLPPLPTGEKVFIPDSTTNAPVSPTLNSTNAAVPSLPVPVLSEAINVNSLLPDVYGARNAMGAANDLLTISPQMLVEYFRGAKGVTNSASVLVPIEFAPASPGVPASTGSSATYRIK